MKNTKTIHFCESYASIAYILYWLEHRETESAVTIFFPSLPDLYTLFQEINEKIFDNTLELISYPQDKPSQIRKFGIFYIWSFIKSLVSEYFRIRGFYRQYFKGVEDTNVTFSSLGYTGIKIYLLEKLRKKNRLVFIDPGPPPLSEYSPHSLKELILLLSYKCQYGYHTRLGKYPPENPWSKGFAMLPENFIHRSVSQIVDWSEREEIMSRFPWEKFSFFNTETYKVIYFHQDLVNRYVPDSDLYSRELQQIFNVVMRYYPEKNIARKYHPNQHKNKDVIQIGDEIPMYIPAEFLYSHNTKIYLGFSSNALSSVRGGQSISLLNIISLTDDSLRERFRERLVRSSRSPILFPSSLEELDRIISEIKQMEAGEGGTNV